MIRSVRRVELLVITSCVGKGTVGDPCRIATTIVNSARPDGAMVRLDPHIEGGGDQTLVDNILEVLEARLIHPITQPEHKHG